MDTKRTCIALSCLLALTVAGAAGASERFEGRALDLSGARLDSTAHFTLHIDEYAEVDEIRGFVELLAEEGQDGLEKALRKLDRGWIKVGPSLGYPISVARSIETDEGRIIRAVTDRPIQMYEVRRGLRSLDYPLGMIELTIGKDGKGEGRLIAAGKIDFNKDGRVEITSLGTQPFRLMNVRLREPKKK